MRVPHSRKAERKPSPPFAFVGWQQRLEVFVAYRLALSACWGSRAGELGELDRALEGWFERSLPWWLEQLRARDGEIRRSLVS